MNLIQANRVSEEKLDHFLKNNQTVNGDSLLQMGYVVEVQDQIEGCFVLEAMDDYIYWLKQLYITKSEAAKLPVLLETILNLAKEQQAKTVYVHSHQPVVDIILESLQFHPQQEGNFVDKDESREGNWWFYSVS
ncbi:N-acetylglutamate synthase-like GNAT family acetyltransferase [Virgibacillus natechei]|uniref:N-acetylglutamate synthase-like GNAT family acetyltransferase n=1 Tax=Virgibacillus natechei TaxID=1216297 RepID=A0ABS4IHR4_9BACI|nr:hypothetical protein [Virgibacillus natechei]MBP1969861.1 N-acetylglutamate synthase-like GNAT family acetyltransferase [Virgibacillus natechei]UZD12609.1 hypothetical protein OLD84_17190 [Virgibacillus natechei]